MAEKMNKIDFNKEKKINSGIGVIFGFLLLSIFFENRLFTYLDEVAAILALFFLLVEFFSSRLKRRLSGISLFLIFLIVEGIISNFLNGPKREVVLILIDILTINKPFLIFLSIIQLSNKSSFDKIKLKTQIIIKLFLLISFFFLMFNCLGVVKMTQETVLNIPNFKFFFGFPVTFAIFIYSLFLFIVDDNRFLFKQFYFWMSMILIFFTLKSQSFFFIIVLNSLYLMINQKKKHLKFSAIITPLIMGGVAVMPAILNYFVTSAYSPRKLLILDGIALAKEYFPFGTGFSTFASPIASQVYSPIYIKQGYYHLYGLGANGDNSFLSDMFLASIVGQFGFLGLFIFFMIIFELLKLLIKNSKASNLNIVATAGLISIVAVTMASSFFTSSVGCFLLATVALVISSKK